MNDQILNILGQLHVKQAFQEPILSRLSRKHLYSYQFSEIKGKINQIEDIIPDAGTGQACGAES